MKSNNCVILRGHLGAAPEAKQLSTGARVVSLRVATNTAWKTEAGEKRERVDWHTVEVWGATGDFCFNYLQKGDHVAVMGSIRNDVVDDPKGKRTYSSVRAWEVTSLTSHADRGTRGERSTTARPSEVPAMATAGASADPDEDLPF